MTLTLCAALMQTVLLVSPTESPDTYAEARRQIAETGRPLVVMVGTDWCGPCQAMKRNVLPKLRERGLFKKVCFAQVNADRDSELAKQLTGGGPVPQLVMYRRTERGWLRRKLVGGQTAEKVEQFIKEELASDEVDQKAGENFFDEDFDFFDLLYMDVPEESAKSTDTQPG